MVLKKQLHYFDKPETRFSLGISETADHRMSSKRFYTHIFIAGNCLLSVLQQTLICFVPNKCVSLKLFLCMPLPSTGISQIIVVKKVDIVSLH